MLQLHCGPTSFGLPKKVLKLILFSNVLKATYFFLLCSGQLKTFFSMNLNGSEKSGGGPSPLGEIARREIKETNILNGGS